MTSSTTFNVIYLGNGNDATPKLIMDPYESGYYVEGKGDFVGQTFGGAEDVLSDTSALSTRVVTLSPIYYAGGQATGSSSSYDSNFNNPDTFSITDPVTGVSETKRFDGTTEYEINVTYADGTIQTIRADVFQAVDGSIYLAPPHGGVSVTGSIKSIEIGRILRNSGLMSPARDDALDFEFAPCFTRGVMIETVKGPVAVEDLKVGDVLVTRDGRDGTIAWIGKRTVFAEGKLAPIRIKRDALGEGVPKKDLVVSPQHRMMVTSEIAKTHFGQSECLVPAVKLLSLLGVSRVKNWETVDYYHVLLKNHEIIYANAAPTESLYLGDRVLRGLDKDSYEEILELFPEILDTSATAARPILDNKMAKSVVPEMKYA